MKFIPQKHKDPEGNSSIFCNCFECKHHSEKSQWCTLTYISILTDRKCAYYQKAEEPEQ